MVVELERNRDVLWQQVDKRLRQRIRSTFRKQIELRDDNSLEGIKRLYSLLQFSYGRARVPQRSMAYRVVWEFGHVLLKVELKSGGTSATGY
jgi:hypothetical protein